MHLLSFSRFQVLRLSKSRGRVASLMYGMAPQLEEEKCLSTDDEIVANLCATCEHFLRHKDYAGGDTQRPIINYGSEVKRYLWDCY